MDKIYTFLVTKSKAEYEPIRTKIASKISHYYKGWCDDYDQQFDDDSIFWILKDQKNSVLSATRLVIPTTSYQKIPAQKADISLSTKHIQTKFLSYSNIGEYSGIWFTNVTYIKSLLALGTQWLINNFPNYLFFAIFDPKIPAFKRLYLRTLHLKDFGHGPIVYNSFKYISDGMPVKWSIVADDPKLRDFRVCSVIQSPGVSTVIQSTNQVIHSSLPASVGNSDLVSKINKGITLI